MRQTEIKTRKPVRRRTQNTASVDSSHERVVLPPRYSGLVWLSAFALTMRMVLGSVIKRFMPH